MSKIVKYLFDVMLQAWRWWRAEITTVLELSLGWKLSRPRLPILMLAADGTYELFVEGGSRLLSAESDLTLDAHKDVALRLPAEWVLRRKLDIPLAALSQAHNAIGFMIERLSPFARNQVYFTFKICQKDHVARMARVEVAIAPRARVDAAVANISKSGFCPLRIEADNTDKSDPFLFKEAVAGRTRVQVHRVAWWLMAAALALVTFGVPALVIALQNKAASLEAEAEALKPIADRAQNLTAEAAQQKQILNDWRAFTDVPRISTLLETLTNRISDDASLFSVEYDLHGFTLHGRARDVPGLLAHISGSPFLAGQLDGAIVAGQLNVGDRFDAKLPVPRAAP